MRILVLEDDRVQQGRIEQTLLDIGRSRNLRLEIDIAKNYGDVEKYSQYFDNYQLYLLDLEIDGERERGFQVAQQVREQDPFTSIVFVSTHSEALPLAFSYHLSALDFISKDQSEEDYRYQLERCLDYVLAVDKRENMRLFTYSFEGRRGFTLPYHEILAFETSVESHRIKSIMPIILSRPFMAVSRISLLRLKKITLSMPIAIRWSVYMPLKR